MGAQFFRPEFTQSSSFDDAESRSTRYQPAAINKAIMTSASQLKGGGRS